MTNDPNLSADRLQVRPEEINKVTGRIILDIDPPPTVHRPAAVRASAAPTRVAAASPAPNPASSPALPSAAVTTFFVITLLLSAICLLVAWQSVAQTKSIKSRLERAEELLNQSSSSLLRDGRDNSKEIARLEGRWEAALKQQEKQDEEIKALRAQIAALQEKVAAFSQIEEVEEILTPAKTAP